MTNPITNVVSIDQNGNQVTSVKPAETYSAHIEAYYVVDAKRHMRGVPVEYCWQVFEGASVGIKFWGSSKTTMAKAYAESMVSEYSPSGRRSVFPRVWDRITEARVAHEYAERKRSEVEAMREAIRQAEREIAHCDMHQTVPH